MDQQLQEALSAMLNKTLSGVDKGVEFLGSEIPDVIEQLLLWHGVKSAIYSIFALVFIISWCKAELVFFKRFKDTIHGDYDYKAAYYRGGSIVRAFVLFFSYKLASLDWLQIWVAPKVWLIEYTSNLVIK